jgi:hypothetical protein
MIMSTGDYVLLLLLLLLSVSLFPLVVCTTTTTTAAAAAVWLANKFKVVFVPFAWSLPHIYSPRANGINIFVLYAITFASPFKSWLNKTLFEGKYSFTPESDDQRV